jgi:transposase-like protein
MCSAGIRVVPEQQEIQSLKKQLWRAKRDNEILKKATVIRLSLRLRLLDHYILP